MDGRMNSDGDNLDSAEVARFAAQADKWWDLEGKYKALHEINPVRLAYVAAHAGLAGCRVLDVGCGGGLLSEAMAVAGARVTGIDMAVPSLEVAGAHARRQGLDIDYRQSTAERWARRHPGEYDVVTCMELVEHVPDPGGLVAACAGLVRPGGDLFFATVNRTALSRVLVIWLSEFVLGIVPKHTHTYEKFVRPEELTRWAGDAGLTLGHLSGVRYLPYIGYAALCKSTAMNYLMHFKRRAV
jgi:2-polyprenyl-6-hydroxyphenyl methylase/3-demethylubiquinone-9 3-methyltransferase